MAIMVPEQQVELQPMQLPGAPQLSDNGLGTLGAGLGAAGKQARDAQIELNRERNATRVLETTNALHDMYRKHKTETQEARVGSAAYGVTGELEGWWETEPAKLAAGLENEVQQELYAEAVARQRSASLDEFSAFESNQRRAGAVSAAEATVVNGVDTAAAGYNNPSSIEAGRAEIENGLATLGLVHSWNDAQRADARKKAFSSLHQQVIENMMEEDPAAAGTYFANNKDEIAGSMHDELQRRITATTDIRVAQRASDDIWNRGLSETEALAAARKELDGPSREHALSLLRQQFNDQEAAVARAQTQQVQAANAAFDEGGYAALTPAMIETLSRVSPATLAGMRKTEPSERVVTNWEQYYTMLQTAERDPSEFLEQTAYESTIRGMGDMNQAEIDKLMKVRAAILEGRPSPVLSVTQRIATYTDSAAFAGADNGERRGHFERQVIEQVELAEARKGSPLNSDEVDAIIDSRLIDIAVSTPWYWTNTTKQQFEMTPADYEEAYTEVPAEEIAIIEAELRRRGVAAPNASQLKQQIVNVYNATNQE